MGEPRVLVVGQGGREHALADVLHGSAEHPRVYVAPGSPGMEPVAERVPIPATDIAGLTSWTRQNSIDLVVIGPEVPLQLGLADALRSAAVDVVGPGQAAARLETSKRFAKDFLRDLGLPTAAYRVAEDPENAERFLAGAAYPLVLKADGLAAGKGVVIAKTEDEARATVDLWMRQGALGDAGRTIVIEEHLEGEEASLMLLTDGERWVLFPAARDHKRLGDGDTGPNTGGMGTCAPARIPEPSEAKAIAARFVDPILRALRERGTPYRGFFYLGLMLTAHGPMVLEINARFGDPEAQVLLPILTEDLLPLARAAARGALPAARHGAILEHGGAAVCVVLAAHGYPGKPRAWDVIQGLDGPWPHGITVYHAGVERRGSQWLTSGGRVLGVTARSETLELARTHAYHAVDRIRFDGMQFRRDIAMSPQPSGA
jgi:phosphoribosylamine---glycine ligase